MIDQCVFERADYLSLSEKFENGTLDDVESELSEHNHDIQDIAYELAYSRYRIAKLEKIIRSAIKQNIVCRTILEDGINTYIED